MPKIVRLKDLTPALTPWSRRWLALMWALRSVHSKVDNFFFNYKYQKYRHAHTFSKDVGRFPKQRQNVRICKSINLLVQSIVDPYPGWEF